MNYWTKLSLQKATSDNYLDNIFDIYNSKFVFNKRSVTVDADKLKKYYDAHDNKNLMLELFKYDRFPVNNSYVAFLRKNPEAIDKNPKIVNLICDQLYTIGFDKMISRIKKAKEPSRQLGNSFKEWVLEGHLGKKIVHNEKDFIKDNSDKVFIASDTVLRHFANDYLGYTGDRGIDIIAMKDKTVYLVEVKLLSNYGGAQENNMATALDLLKRKYTNNVTEYNIKSIAVLDGICWLNSNNKLHKKIINSNSLIMSALELKDFLEK